MLNLTYAKTDTILTVFLHRNQCCREVVKISGYKKQKGIGGGRNLK